MNNTPNNDNPINAFFQWIDNGLRWAREQAENFIANNPQAYVSSIQLLFTISRAISEAYEPIALQNARNYVIALREQKKIYDLSLQYENPMPLGSWEWVSYEINVCPHKKSN